MALWSECKKLIDNWFRNFFRSNVLNNDGKRDNLVTYNNIEMQWCKMEIYTVSMSASISCKVRNASERLIVSSNSIISFPSNYLSYEFYQLTFTFYNIIQLPKDPIAFNHLILLFWSVNIVDTTIALDFMTEINFVEALVYKVRQYDCI